MSRQHHNMHDDLMPIKAVAEYLDIHVQTAFKLAREGKLPAMKVGNKWIVSRVALKKFLGVPEEKAVQA